MGIRKKIPLLLLAFLFLLAGCAPAAPDRGGLLKVLLAQAPHVDCARPSVYVRRGEDAVFHLTVEEGYSVESADYAGSEFGDGRGEVTLIVPDVSYPVTVTLQVSERVRLVYDANGGTFAEGAEQVQEQDVTYRKRPNTARATLLQEREGYTLIGWNDRADGSGTHVGLGSRVTAKKGGDTLLYAEWAEWTAEERFTYRTENGKARIVGYTGADERIVIPARLGGMPVASIGTNAFLGAKAETVVFPASLERVETGAFVRCALRELYLFDLPLEISDESFVSCADLSTVHINAAQRPRYPAITRNSRYADKLDLLYAESELPRLVFFAGSSAWFNLKGEVIEQATEGRYKIVDLGLNGLFGGIVQLEIMTALLREGDVVVHTPEPCSSQQLLVDREMSLDMFIALEGNYDLFALADIRSTEGEFSALVEYNEVRANLFPAEYTDLPTQWQTDEYGCYAPFLPQHGEDENLPDAADVRPDYLKEGNISVLNGHYAQIFERTGNRVLLSYSAVNLDGLPETCTEEVWEEYEQRLVALADAHYAAVFGKLSDGMYRGRWFCGSNFHLSTDGAYLWSQTFAESLAEQMKMENNL